MTKILDLTLKQLRGLYVAITEKLHIRTLVSTLLTMIMIKQDFVLLMKYLRKLTQGGKGLIS